MRKNGIGVAVVAGGLLFGLAQQVWAMGDFTRLAYLRYLHLQAERAARMSPQFLTLPGGVPSDSHVLSLLGGDTASSRTPRSGTFDQRINHLDPTDTRTFKQRYFVLSAFASGPEAPVLYMICGEATCSEYDLEGAVAHDAEKYHAYVVALEHRYYGKSQPFPALTTENLRYLSVDQALSDLDAFERYARAELGMKGKWVSVGGSYSGSLSAYFRQKYPEDVEGALASSAPVRALENFELYDWSVNQGVGKACGDAMRATVHAVETTLSDEAKLAQVKKLFDAENVKNPVDFLYIMADMGAMAVQYGHREEFCNEIAREDAPAGRDPSNTQAQTQTNDQDLIARYAKAGKTIFKEFGITPEQDSLQAAESLNPDDYLAGGIGLRSWAYQSCKQFGYFQTAYHDPSQSVRSALINLDYNHWACDHLFGLKGPVEADQTNQEFYQPLLTPGQASRILFTNGSTDPWADLSITLANGNASLNPDIEVRLIQGGAHCDDLRQPQLEDSASLEQAREAFETLLGSWF